MFDTKPYSNTLDALERSADFFAVFGFRSGPDGFAQAVGFIWSLLRAKLTIPNPFGIKFVVFGPERNFGQPGLDLA